MGATNVFTYTLTQGSINIASSDNVNRLSILCKAGTTLFQGTATFKNLVTGDNSLSAGQGITLMSSSISNPLDGITITCATDIDVCEIMLSYS